jgi:hypothetical protein
MALISSYVVSDIREEDSVCENVRNSAKFYCKNAAEFRKIPRNSAYFIKKILSSAGSKKTTSVDTLGT